MEQSREIISCLYTATPNMTGRTGVSGIITLKPSEIINYALKGQLYKSKKFKERLNSMRSKVLELIPNLIDGIDNQLEINYRCDKEIFVIKNETLYKNSEFKLLYKEYDEQDNIEYDLKKTFEQKWINKTTDYNTEEIACFQAQETFFVKHTATLTVPTFEEGKIGRNDNYLNDLDSIIIGQLLYTLTTSFIFTYLVVIPTPSIVPYGLSKVTSIKSKELSTKSNWTIIFRIPKDAWFSLGREFELLIPSSSVFKVINVDNEKKYLYLDIIQQNLKEN